MKKVLLVTFLALLSICMLSAGDYRIGTGTSTQNKVPIYGYADYGWSKFFITADELAASGISGSTQITKIAFQVSNSPSGYVMDNQKIYLAHYYNSYYTSSTDNFPTGSSYTQVYNGTITWSGPGWFEIELMTPYTYAGQWGLEIVWENRDGSKIGGPPSFYTSSTSGSTSVHKSGNSFLTNDGTRVSSRPNVWLMSPPTDVPPPAEAVVPTDAATGISVASHLSWNHTGGSPDYYKLWLGTDNPPSNLITAQNVYDNSFDIPQYLDYSTTYYWRIVPHNDFGFAFDCPVWSFTTEPDPTIYAFPYTENFDGSFNPSGWNDYQGGLVDPIILGSDGSSQWQQDDWLNTASTDKAAKVDIWGSVSGYLISPLLNIANDDFVLEFDLALMDYNNNNPISSDPNGLTGVDDRFAILVGDGFTWSSANIVREWNNTGSSYVLNDVPNTGTHVTIPLAGLTGRKRIAIYAGSTASNADNDLMINNFVVREAEAVLASPEPVISYDNNTNQVTISWNEIPGATIYEIYSSVNPETGFELIGTSASPSYQVPATPTKAFFKIVASPGS